MRDLALTAIVGLLILAPAAGAEDEVVIPQDPAQRARHARERLEWNRRLLVDSYEKVGNKDPRWDGPAREALTKAALLFAGQGGPDTRPEDVYKAARLAVDAGCDDPMILHVYATTSRAAEKLAAVEYKRRMAEATRALEASRYPAIKRGLEMMRHALAMTSDKMPQEDREECGRLLDAALRLIPESLAQGDQGRQADEVRYTLAWDIMSGQKFLTGDYQAAFEKVEAVLSKVPALKVACLQLEGEYLTYYAWEARGIGLAPTVTEEGWRKFGERLARADKALREAWAAEPSGERTPTLMMTVLKGTGCERPEMETWFRRAMEADVDNFNACFAMMDWLDPKWHGSPEEVLAFGRACRDTKNWQARITLLAADAHIRAVQLKPSDEYRAYFARPEVWDDIRTIFEDYLSHRPNDAPARSTYAAFCYNSNKIEESARQFEKVGARLYATNFYTLDQMKEFRAHVLRVAKERAKERAEEQAKEAEPPARPK